ncbi:putative membrane protein [Nocardiopsis mwathae]|uniref:Putative membrane protein n=1 Tax=Nocardiopsis mwathae TaxID=1472723 RepID=A0A7W9YIA1_9ACTN|nr:anthrone oxygenase family protein [Nocardiopsis mwathae]MBB6171686.1 putative membrane protein [Nocardiopsis mwathae]
MDFEIVRGIVLLAATLTTGLVAGLFYAYDMSVMRGLARAEDRTFVDTMQRINVAILNGWFALAFVGAPVLTIAAIGLHLGPDARTVVLPWTVAAFVLYATMLAITAVVHIPLNNQIDKAGPLDEIGDFAAVRARFETRWVRWNIARTATSTGAFACLAWSLVLFGGL